ncbi:MAG: CoA-binding protein [Chitinophagales bacterium]
MKKTLVLGASENTERYSNKAVNKLRIYGHEVIAVGRKAGKIGDLAIQESMPEGNDIDTLTLYLNPENQKPYYESIIALHPKRIIFNPGTENPELYELAHKNNIETIEACTLVLLSVGDY